MEEKKVSKRQSSFWSIFNNRSFTKFFLRKFNLLKSSKSTRFLSTKKNFNFSSKFSGFTLIELLVVIAMVGVMLSFLIILINPYKQIQKARDAEREQNLKQISTALDTYYNDNACFPVSLSFGSNWQQGSAVYMQEIPQDPDCAGGGYCYAYITDPSSCPQWNVLFAKVFSKPNSSVLCPLEQLSDCVPDNYEEEGYNYCVLSGDVDCSYISGISLPSAGSASPTPTPGGPTASPTPIPSGPTPTFTPTPTPGGCSLNYSCTGSPLRCNVVSPAGSGQYCASNCNGNCP